MSGDSGIDIDPTLAEALDLVVAWRDSTSGEGQGYWASIELWTAKWPSLLADAAALYRRLGGGRLEVIGDAERGRVSVTGPCGEVAFWTQWQLAPRSRARFADQQR